MVLLVLFAFAVKLSLAGQPSLPQYQILLVIPEAGLSEWSWEGGAVLDIVELAQQTVQNLSFKFDLSVKTLEVDCTSLILAQLVQELITSGDSLTVAVVGFYCKKTLQELELIGVGSRDHLGLVQISVNTFLPETMGSSRPYYYQMFPSSLAYAEALSHFMNHVGWTRLGIAFAENQDSYHFEISQHVLRALNEKAFVESIETFKVNNDIVALREHNVMQVIKMIHTSGVKIVYVLLPPLEAAMLVCRAYDYGLRWPDYAWIIPDINIENINLESELNCDSQAMQGIMYFQTILSSKASVRVSLQNFQNSNIYERAVYDSILATALSFNLTFPQVQDFLQTEKSNFSSQRFKIRAQKHVSHMIGKVLSNNVSFIGALGNLLFNRSSGVAVDTKVTISQIIKGKSFRVGTYNPVSNTSHYILPTVAIPSDKLAREYSRLPASLVALLTTFMTICFLIAVVNFVLYVHYRNAPEIKASSFRLSLVIHISSIILMIGGQFYISISGVVLDESFPACNILNWLIYPWGDAILATLLVKISRIQYIFSHYKGKINLKLCSDTVLLFFIAAIFAGKVFILSLWTSLDPFTNTDIEIYHPETKPPYYEVEQHCLSHHYFLWLCTCLGYTAILGGVLGYVAFKARKVPKKDFNDTKKINTTVSVAFVTIAVVVPMWWTFRAAGHTNASTSLLSIMYMILPLSCQICLFLPKTLPPLMRSISGKETKSKKPDPQLRKMFFKRFSSSKFSLMQLSSPTTTTTMNAW